jgi:hypothetical protein
MSYGFLFRLVTVEGERADPPTHSSAVSNIKPGDQIPRQEEEDERIRALSPEERIQHAQTNWRRLCGHHGGTVGRYQPSPAKAGR